MESLKEQIDRLPGRLLITDTRSKVVYTNQAVERRTGFAVAEMVGKRPGELWGGRMERSFYDTMWQTIGKEGRPFIGRVHNVRKDKTAYAETLYIAPIPEADGQIRYFAHMHPDLREAGEEAAFQAEFKKHAGSFARDRHPLRWLFRSL